MPEYGSTWLDPQVMMRLLSTERMSTYLNACDGHLDEAFVLSTQRYCGDSKNDRHG